MRDWLYKLVISLGPVWWNLLGILFLLVVPLVLMWRIHRVRSDAPMSFRNVPLGLRHREAYAAGAGGSIVLGVVLLLAGPGNSIVGLALLLAFVTLGVGILLWAGNYAKPGDKCKPEVRPVNLTNLSIALLAGAMVSLWLFVFQEMLSEEGEDRATDLTIALTSDLRGFTPPASRNQPELPRDLDGYNFRGKDLRRANFNATSLVGADLSFTLLDGATFQCADLTGADLRSAYARGADFSGANLTNTNLTEADLSKTLMYGAHGEPKHVAGLDVRGAATEDPLTDLDDAESSSDHFEPDMEHNARLKECENIGDGAYIGQDLVEKILEAQNYSNPACGFDISEFDYGHSCGRSARREARCYLGRPLNANECMPLPPTPE